MKTPYRLVARQVRARILAGAGDVDEVDVLGSNGAPILPDLHSTKRAGAIVVDGESGIDHAMKIALDPLGGYVAEAHSGGHDPEPIMRRSDGRAIARFGKAMSLADEIVVLGNTGDRSKALLRISDRTIHEDHLDRDEPVRDALGDCRVRDRSLR